MTKIILVLIVFYFLVLFQSTFLVHFDISSFIPNLVFISVILISLFEGANNSFNVFPAFAGGFFLDIFSAGYIGTNVLILLGLVVFIKIILRRYVRSPVR